MSRFSRKFAAVLAVLGLLFAQWAVASFPCPMITQALAAADSTQMAMPCHQPDGTAQAGDALCHKHCLQDDRATSDQVVNLPVVFIAAYVVAMNPAVENGSAILAARVEHQAAAPPPPISLLYARFQI